jgi:hypothetical protein
VGGRFPLILSTFDRCLAQARIEKAVKGKRGKRKKEKKKKRKKEKRSFPKVFIPPRGPKKNWVVGKKEERGGCQ